MNFIDKKKLNKILENFFYFETFDSSDSFSLSESSISPDNLLLLGGNEKQKNNLQKQIDIMYNNIDLLNTTDSDDNLFIKNKYIYNNDINNYKNKIINNIKVIATFVKKLSNKDKTKANKIKNFYELQMKYIINNKKLETINNINKLNKISKLNYYINKKCKKILKNI